MSIEPWRNYDYQGKTKETQRNFASVQCCPQRMNLPGTWQGLTAWAMAQPDECTMWGNRRVPQCSSSWRIQLSLCVKRLRKILFVKRIGGDVFKNPNKQTLQVHRAAQSVRQPTWRSNIARWQKETETSIWKYSSAVQHFEKGKCKTGPAQVHLTKDYTGS
jgi:hypothetical protein